MFRFYKLFFLGCVATTSFGCQAILDYPVDRAKDFVDVVGFDIYWGQGVVVHGQMTKLAQVGLGSFDGDILKCHRRACGVVEEMRSEGGLPFYYFTAYDRKIRLGNTRFWSQDLSGIGEVHYNLKDPNDRGFYEFGATLGVMVGLGFDIDLLQTLDFMTGWFGIDFGRDDARNKGRQRVENPRYKSVDQQPVSGEVVVDE